MKVSKVALVAALALGTTAFLGTTATDAQSIRNAQKQREETQRRQQRAQPQQAQVAALTPAENTAIAPLFQAVRAQNWAAAAAALAAAQAGAQSPYAKYVVGQLQYELGRGTQNQQMQAEATDAMVASGGAPAEQMRPLLGNQVAYAVRSQSWAAAEAPLTRLVEMEPNNIDRLQQLAEVKLRLNKRPEAFALYQRVLQMTEASGQTAPEPVYQQALAIAYEGRMAQPTLEMTRALLRAYPTPDNWRRSVLIYRQTANADGVLNLDIRRFMRAAQLLREPAEYIELADALSRGGLPGEVKAVLEEGISRRVLQARDADVQQLMATANARLAEDRASLAGLRTQALAGGTGRLARTTADAHFGYGLHAQAAELYRAALQRGGEDANLLNLRLGMALALAGQRAEAETAFRAVTGPRSELANYWLLWLARPPR